MDEGRTDPPQSHQGRRAELPAVSRSLQVVKRVVREIASQIVGSRAFCFHEDHHRRAPLLAGFRRQQPSLRSMTGILWRTVREDRSHTKLRCSLPCCRNACPLDRCMQPHSPACDRLLMLRSRPSPPPACARPFVGKRQQIDPEELAPRRTLPKERVPSFGFVVL